MAEKRLRNPGRFTSLLGTYLAAIVFAAALYDRSPIGVSYTAGLSKEQAGFAQKIAWETVKAFYDR